MPRATVNGVSLYYEETGAPSGKPVVLISGLGTQLTRWSEPFTARLAQRGCRVVRLDNRDAGLSESFDAHGVPDLKAVVAARDAGQRPALAYTLDDMADDVAGLLDHLGIARAHVAGSSMGGMIAQLLAIRHPARVASLTSIMSTTGNPDLPRATPQAQDALTRPRADPVQNREAYLDDNVLAAQIIGSPAYPVPPGVLRERIAADLDRAYRVDGFARQYAAIVAAPDRRDALARLDVPTLVIHGSDDPLIRLEAGRDTAAAIPGARLLEIPGMGHDLPDGVHAAVVDAILDIASQAHH